MPINFHTMEIGAILTTIREKKIKVRIVLATFSQKKIDARASPILHQKMKRLIGLVPASSGSPGISCSSQNPSLIRTEYAISIAASRLCLLSHLCAGSAMGIRQKQLLTTRG
jgi:hypothetical protein